MIGDPGSRGAAFVDVVPAIVVFAGARTILGYYNVPKPASIAVVVTLVAVSLRLRQLGISWADLGLAWPSSLPVTVVIGIASYLATVLAIALISTPLANALGLAPSAFQRLGELDGNTVYAVFMVVVTGWGAAAFGEELLFRGFLLNGISASFGGGTLALAMAVASQAPLFGLGHFCLGARGVLEAGTVGLVFGTVNAISGGNLWPLIIAHGLIDTISLYLLYAGWQQS